MTGWILFAALAAAVLIKWAVLEPWEGDGKEPERIHPRPHNSGH